MMKTTNFLGITNLQHTQIKKFNKVIHHNLFLN